MSVYFGESARCNISALLGSDYLLRVSDGILSGIETQPIYDIESGLVYDERTLMLYPSTIIGHELTLNIRTGPEAYSIEKLECKCDSLPISDKRVDDCTVNELLFAIQKKMGLIPEFK